MGAADVHLDHDGRAAICGDVNAVGRVNNEGLVNGVVALEGLTGIRVGHILVRPLLDCGVLDMHSGLAGGRVKSEPGRARCSTRRLQRLQLRQPAEPEQVPRPRVRELKHKRPATQ